MSKIDTKSCAKVEAIHPCDPPPPCDPFFEANDCPSPYICQERLKNPAFPGEITTCQPGSFMYVKSCVVPEPPHICDPLKPCSEIEKSAHPKKPRCIEPPLCLERVKNPSNEYKKEPCDPTK